MIKKKKNGLKCLIILTVLLFSIADVFGLQCVMNDLTFYPVPDIPRPGKGETYVDPVFHTNITRITDSSTDVDSTRLYSYCQPGYPKHNIENADGTKLLIQCAGGSGWAIFDANPPYFFDHFIPSSTIGWGRSIDARWDNTNPNILYFTMNYLGYKLYRYDITTQTPQIIHDFEPDVQQNWPELEITEINMLEEGDASDDRRYWAYVVIAHDENHAPKWWRTALIVYDKDYYSENDGKIIAVLNEGDQDFYGNGFASMSPSGEYVWTGDDHRVYPRDLSSVRIFDGINSGHADMAYSAEGREVIAGSKWHSGTQSHWAAMADLETGEVTYLHPLGTSGYHTSANSHLRPGWAVYSSYYPEYPEPEDSWGDHEVYMVELTTRTDPLPRVWRLAHTQGILVSYNDAPFAKINMKGTKVFFGSAWGSHYNDNCSVYDTFQIDLPEECFDYFPDDMTIQPECNDTIDNDGDGETDYPDDGGCGSLTDDDETDCGDDVCEGEETCSASSCPEDCLDTGEQCCNGVAYDPTDRVCCSGAVYAGNCCIDSDCGLSGSCNLDNHSCTNISTCQSGADKDDSGVVSMDEVVAFIEDWKTGSVTIAKVLDAIGEWKDGC